MNLGQYLELRQSILLKKVSFGSQTVTLFDVDELNEAQLGYSIDPAGNSLIGNNAGDWKTGWVVIAYEDLLGDPIFVDLEQETLPVFTAMHGTGVWHPEQIASSFHGFIKALEGIERVSDGRKSPVELEHNPLTPSEQERVLEQIAEANKNVSLDFWSSWLAG